MMQTMIQLPDRFDYSQHNFFMEQCDAALRQAGVTSLVLDFSRVLYLDSSAIGMLVSVAKKAAPQHIDVRIRGAQGTARDILMMANLGRLYGIDDE
jgi:anti-anti-sigma factor